MALGKPAVLTPKALDLRAVQGTIGAIRERLQFIESALATAGSPSTAQASDISTLQFQLAQLTARVTAVERAVRPGDTVSLVAGGAIAAGDPVVATGLNTCATVDVTDPTAVYAVIGLAQTAAVTGQTVVVTRQGSFPVVEGTLDVGRAVYANLGGGLTQYPSYTEVAIPVGVATGATTVWVDPGWPALQALGFESGYEDFLPAATGLVRDAVLLTEDFNVASNGLVAKVGENNVTARTLTGTASRMAVSNGDGVGGNPTVDIDAAYVGQASITTVGTIGTGTWAGTAVAADHGGTGLTSFVIGDLVYANTATTLAKLPDVATGNALLSGGIGAAPAWGKVGLTTHVTGILPEANGGTGTSTRPYVLLAGDTMTGGLVISMPTAPSLNLNPATDSVQALVQYSTNGLARWVLRKENTPESGANAGSNFGIRRYNDAGTFIEDALLITRSTGNVSIPQALTVTGAVSGASFTVTNSTVPVNGMYRYATNAIGWSVNSVASMFLSAAGNLGVGIAPVSGVKLQVKVGTDQNVSCLTQSSSATITGLTDGGSSAPLRVVGNSLTLSGNGSADHLTVASTGQVSILTLGRGLSVKEGSNAKQGVATLVAGTVTVANTSALTNSRILLTVQSLGTVTAPKAVAVTARVNATSFTITSADATDTSVVAYEIFEAA